MNAMIYHYTSIKTLELILKSKKIRFKRLDKVDDKDESEPFKNKPIADKIFVSCWTEVEEENLALWHMYGDAYKGIRIGLKEPLFRLNTLNISSWNGIKILNETNRKTLFLPGEMINEKFFIVPSFWSRSQFYKKIEYVKLNELEDLYNKYSNFSEVNGVFNITLDLHEIAKFKSDMWQQQAETRFVLCIIPFANKLESIPDFNNPDSLKNFTDNLVTSLVKDIKLDFTYFEIDLDEERLNDIEILAGPKSDINLLDLLLKKYVTNYRISKSKLNINLPNIT